MEHGLVFILPSLPPTHHIPLPLSHYLSHLTLSTKANTSASIILRGANDFMCDEMERSLHDALCVVKRVLESKSVVPGGGAVEAALSIYLENYATSMVSAGAGSLRWGREPALGQGACVGAVGWHVQPLWSFISKMDPSKFIQACH